jgi:NAD(P)-dependent dehydrogenase (short-subunit alcohol dehydrogenase family)
LAEAEDVANAVLFLAGEGSTHIHGAVLDVNGGMY